MSRILRAERVMFSSPMPRTRRLLERLHRIGLGPGAESIEMHLGGKRMPDGSSLSSTFRRHLVRIHNALRAEISSRRTLGSNWYRKESVPRVRLHLEYRLWNEIRSVVEAASYVLWHIEQESSSGAETSEHVLVIPQGTWGPELKPHLEDLCLAVRLIPTPLHGWWPLLHRSLGAVRRVMRHRVKPRADEPAAPESTGRNSQSGDRLRVVVGFTRSTDPAERNDLFWFEGSGLRPEDVLVSFESGSYPVSDHELRQLRSRGFDFVVHTQAALLNGGGVIWMHSPRLEAYRVRTAAHALRLLLAALRSRLSRWEWVQVVRLMDRVDRWQDFFESTDVRVDIRLSDNEAAQAIALDNLGGIAMRVQYATGLVSPGYPHVVAGNHVLFCWGSAFTHFVDTRSTRPENMVLSGYLFDRYFAPAAAQVREIRKSLHRAGAEFIVAHFDQAYSLAHNPASVLTPFYAAFLRMCVEDRTFGLVVKPKGNETLALLPEVQPLLRAAIDTGRCVVLEDPAQDRRAVRNKNPIFPVVAALASDLSVNMLSTAGLEGVLAGVNCLHYDPWLDPMPPNDLLYACDNGTGRLVFQDIDELVGAIREHRETPGGLPGLGDHGPILDQIDPFRDGRAGERIGTYIRWLLEDLNAGLSRDEALARANQRYAEAWGDDKIIAKSESHVG